MRRTDTFVPRKDGSGNRMTRRVVSDEIPEARHENECMKNVVYCCSSPEPRTLLKYIR